MSLKSVFFKQIEIKRGAKVAIFKNITYLCTPEKQDS